MAGPTTPKKWAIALVASAVLSPFILFSSPLKSWQGDSWIASVGQEILYPFEYGWHFVRSNTFGVVRNYFALTDTAKENQMLRKQLARLQTRIMDHEEQKQENTRLRQLLGFHGRFEKNLLAAEVVGSSSGTPFQSLRITRGSTDGVLVGMPVVAAGGIVGRVIRTGLKFSDVQLLVDGDFHMDVLLQRTRVRGVIGGARNHCRLNLHKRAEIRIGDTVISSGLVGAFPKGLPVGRVVKIAYESAGVAQLVTVEPWIDYRRLEEVMVLFQIDQELQKIIETAGAEWVEKTVGQAQGG